jgi:predicted RNA-binding protein with PIN domain
MALVRILVDGYSLLHNWPELAPDKPRHSAAARDELIRILTLYRDAIATPLTIVFDGANAPAGAPRPVSTPEMEVLYSRAGQTADDIIERVAFRMREYGEVLAVTDDYVERDTVLSLDGLADELPAISSATWKRCCASRSGKSKATTAANAPNSGK